MSALVLEDHDFAAMVGEIWSSILMPEPVEEHDIVPVGEVLAGYVDISGGWHGRVVVETTNEGAVAIAASMFDLTASDLAHADLVDAVGELANIVGGSVKSCIDGHAALSLPAVETARAEDGQGSLLSSVSSWQGHPLRVSVRTPGSSAQQEHVAS
jgi:chemotaxis protein CheX